MKWLDDPFNIGILVPRELQPLTPSQVLPFTRPTLYSAFLLLNDVSACD